MSQPSDHVDEMPDGTLSDEAIEAFFVGTPDPGWERAEPLVALAGHMAVAVAGPAPTPDHALLQLFWGSPAAVEPTRTLVEPAAWGARVTRDDRSAVLPWRSRLRVLASVTMGAAVALVGVGAAGATGVLPAPVQRVVARAVEAVTPFELPAPSGDRPAKPSGNGTADIVRDGGGASSSPSGGETSGSSPASPPEQPQRVPATPASGAGAPSGPGSTGLDRASQTPAATSTPASSGVQAPATASPPPASAVPAPAQGLNRTPQPQAGAVAPSSVPGPPGSRAPGRR